MFKLVELIQNKPSDKNIRIMRTVFAIILTAIIYFGFTQTYFEYSQIPKEALYALYIFPVIGFIRGIFDPGVFRKKIWKWTQVGIGTTMMVLSIFLIETNTEKETLKPIETTGGTLTLDNISEDSKQMGAIDTDFWLGFMGFIYMINGLVLTSKNITKKNERYGEIVKKIRI